MEVNHLRQLGGTTEPPQANHSQTVLWVPPSADTPQDAKLVVAPTHVEMVQFYPDLLEEAMTKRHENVDQWSFECDPVAGALTCSAAYAHPSEDDVAAAGHRNRLPSSPNNEEDRPDPPIEAHQEPQDRASSFALTDVPDGRSAAPTNHKKATRRPDWTLWKAACMLEMEDLVASGTIVLGMPPLDAKTVQSMIQYCLKNNDAGLPEKRKARLCARGDTSSAEPDVPIFTPTAPWGDGEQPPLRRMREQLVRRNLRRQVGFHISDAHWAP